MVGQKENVFIDPSKAKVMENEKLTPDEQRLYKAILILVSIAFGLLLASITLTAIAISLLKQNSYAIQ